MIVSPYLNNVFGKGTPATAGSVSAASFGSETVDEVGDILTLNVTATDGKLVTITLAGAVFTDTGAATKVITGTGSSVAYQISADGTAEINATFADVAGATAPTKLEVSTATAHGATVTGSTIDMLSATTGNVTSFADGSADSVKLSVTLAANTTATYQVQTVGGSYGAAAALTDAGIDNIDLGSSAGDAKIKVTVSQADCNDVVYELTISAAA